MGKSIKTNFQKEENEEKSFVDNNENFNQENTERKLNNPISEDKLNNTCADSNKSETLKCFDNGIDNKNIILQLRQRPEKESSINLLQQQSIKENSSNSKHQEGIDQQFESSQVEEDNSANMMLLLRSEVEAFDNIPVILDPDDDIEVEDDVSMLCQSDENLRLLSTTDDDEKDTQNRSLYEELLQVANSEAQNFDQQLPVNCFPTELVVGELPLPLLERRENDEQRASRHATTTYNNKDSSFLLLKTIPISTKNNVKEDSSKKERKDENMTLSEVKTTTSNVLLPLERRCSYEEVVHDDEENEAEASETIASNNKDCDTSSKDSEKLKFKFVQVRKLISSRRRAFSLPNPSSPEFNFQSLSEYFLVVLNNWTHNLAEVLGERTVEAEQRSQDSFRKASRFLLNRKSSKAKTADLLQQISRLDSNFGRAANYITDRYDLEELHEEILSIQQRLRSQVTIRVSQPPATHHEAVQAVYFAEENAAKLGFEGAVSFMLENISDLVRKISAVDHSTEDDNDDEENGLEDDDICMGVEALRLPQTETSPSRKRKTFVGSHNQQQPFGSLNVDSENKPKAAISPQKQTSKSLPTSPTSSPRKRMRIRSRTSNGVDPSSMMVKLLEAKAKAVNQNGLYQYVLWRETLKSAEKSRKQTSRLDSSCHNSSMDH